MTLRSLRILGKEDGGIGSGHLAFGRCTTLLLGDNGSGKTPVMKALSLVLGQPVQLPPPVGGLVRRAVLSFQADGQDYTIEREFNSAQSAPFSARTGEDVRRFRGEQEYSEFLLPLLGVRPRNLAHVNGGVAKPYLSVFGPLFVVQQDSGWLLPYAGYDSSRFVRDQREEVIRWALELPPRHRPVDRDAYEDAKVAQLAAQQQVAVRRRVVEELASESGVVSDSESLDSLERRIGEAEERLRTVFQRVLSASQISDDLIRAESSASAELESARGMLESLEARRRRLIDVEREVMLEIGALEENEVAAHAFRSFCGNDACALFRRPNDSFGRRMLFLRDQLKDFELSTSETSRQVDELREAVARAEERRERARQAVEEVRRTQVPAPALTAAREAGEGVAELRRRLSLAKLYADAVDALKHAILVEARCADAVAGLRPTAGSRRDLTRQRDVQRVLALSFERWLDVLHTPNLTASPAVDDEMYFVVNGDRLREQSPHSGSSRARMVLAAHAALLETSVEMGGSHPRLLVLDAPRQQELSADHLRDFVRHFYSLFANSHTPVQLVFSATDSSVAPNDCVDVVWRPTFEHDGVSHYLG